MSADLFNIIFIGGKDRVDFLQGQVTQDIEKLDENTTRNAAFCNPKGRVIATCQLFQFNEKIGVIIHHTMSEIIINRLKKFIFRSDVNIELSSDVWSSCFKKMDSNEIRKKVTMSSNQFIVINDLKESGAKEIFSNTEKIEILKNPMKQEDWKAARMTENLVDISIQHSEKYTPHMLNMDVIDGISFQKGCYVGQEVVARTEHIGRVKRRVIVYKLDSTDIKLDDKLFHNGKDTGAQIISIEGIMMMAIINIIFKEKSLQYEGGNATPFRAKL